VFDVGEPVAKLNIRKYPRVMTRIPVEYALGDRKARVRASTLGGGGMFIEDPQPLPQDAEIQVRFRPARHLPYLQAKARVIYVQPKKGSGLQFTEISPEQRQLILRLIHHKSASRRKSPRVPLATQIHIRELMGLAYSRDVSVGGMFVETTLPCEIGTRVDLRFHLNDGGPIVVTAGEVRYIVPKMGMGVLFVGLAKGDRQRIENLIANSSTFMPETKSAEPAS